MLKPLLYVRARDLEECAGIGFLKHEAFQLGRLVGNQNCQQRVIGRIDGYVPSHKLFFGENRKGEGTEEETRGIGGRGGRFCTGGEL